MAAPVRKLKENVPPAPVHEDHAHEDDSFHPPHAAKHEDGEGLWLISYADLMTLLMGFFALMLSFSKFNDEEFEKAREEAVKHFGGEYQKPFGDLAAALSDSVSKMGLADQVKIETNPSGVTMTFQGTLFFDSGSVELREQAMGVLDQIIPVVKEKAPDFALLFEGHTDNVPIASKTMPSNWELSGFRASAVARLFASRGFKNDKMMIVGWGETRPVLPNNGKNNEPLPENQAQNRRVVIKILRQAIM